MESRDCATHPGTGFRQSKTDPMGRGAASDHRPPQWQLRMAAKPPYSSQSTCDPPPHRPPTRPMQESSKDVRREVSPSPETAKTHQQKTHSYSLTNIVDATEAPKTSPNRDKTEDFIDNSLFQNTFHTTLLCLML